MSMSTTPGVLTLQVGGAGNKIAEAFWRTICAEHCVNHQNGYFFHGHDCPADKILMDSFFSLTPEGKLLIRGIAIACKTDAVEAYKNGSMTAMINAGNVISGSRPTENNFAIGHTDAGEPLMEPAMEAVRAEAEQCQNLQAFNIFHAIQGGTGSGVTALLIDRLLEQYPKAVLCTTSLLPSETYTVPEGYNAALTIPYLVKTHQTFLMHNEQLRHVAVKRLQYPETNYEDLNSIISHTFAGITATMRFPSSIYSGFRKIYHNVVPRPDLHMLVPTFSPACHLARTQMNNKLQEEAHEELISNKNSLALVDYNSSYIATAEIYRGEFYESHIVSKLLNLPEASWENYSADGETPRLRSHYAFCDVCGNKSPCAEYSGAALINTKGITKGLKPLLEHFNVNFRAGQYKWHYTKHGMEDAQFEEASTALEDVIHAYENA